MQEFNDSELNYLFIKHVRLSPSYFQKYRLMPPCPIRSYNYAWGNNDFPRNWCVLDFIEWTKKHTLTTVKTLGYTSTTDPELEFIKADESLLVEYPEYDLHTISSHFNNKFDFFIFNQTIEHLYNPYKAVNDIFKIVKEGGYVFTSVPTLNIPHMTPKHFTGFTPMGLAMLFKTNGFDIVEIGQWGNYEYINTLWATHRWPGYNTLQKNGCIENEEQNVCQCWILARKPISTSIT